MGNSAKVSVPKFRTFYVVRVLGKVQSRVVLLELFLSWELLVTELNEAVPVGAAAWGGRPPLNSAPGRVMEAESGEGWVEI